MAPIFDENEGLYYRVEVWDGDRVDPASVSPGRHSTRLLPNILAGRSRFANALGCSTGRRFGRAAGPSLTRLPDIHVAPVLLMSSAMARCTLTSEGRLGPVNRD